MAVDTTPDWIRSPFAQQGWVLRVAAALGVQAGDGLHVPRLIAIVIGLAWLPLLILCLVEGTAYGDRVAIPFLRDYFVYGRYFVAAPLLLLMDVIVERRTSQAVAQLRDSGLIAGSEDAVQRIVLTASRAWRSRTLRVSMLAIAGLSVALAYWFARTSDVSGWMFDHKGEHAKLSLAGAWNVFVSAAIVKFLFARALCKLAIWLWTLQRLSRLPLRVIPLHPDRACGLRFFGQTQLAFTPFICALGVQLGASIAGEVRYLGHDLSSFKWLAVAFVIASIVLLLAPLLVFERQARLAREDAELRFGAWASHAARYTADERVAPRGDPADQLSQPEISAFTDASAIYASVMEAWSVPFGKPELIAVIAAAIVPMTLPLLLLVPLKSVAKELLKILL